MDARLKLLKHALNIAGIHDRQLLPPVMVDVDPVDGVCNLDCDWCCQAASRASRPATFMSMETMGGLGFFCAQWGVKSWRISGDSEPLLNKDINALLQSGHANGIDMGLITNGVYLHRVEPQWLQKLTYLGVSLDAATPETWARLKGDQPRNFHLIVNNVRAARKAAPDLDISLKFLKWNPETNLHKRDFGGNGLPVVDQTEVTDMSNHRDAEILPGLAKSLGVRAIIKDAYPVDMAKLYNFETCHATPLGGVFDASHKFHLCCDARNRFVLTDDYTRNNWRELLDLWGSPEHWAMIDAIIPQKCAGCAKFRINEALDKLVIEPDKSEQVNFI